MEPPQRQHTCHVGSCGPGGMVLPQGALLEAFCFPMGVSPPVLAPTAFSLAYSPPSPTWRDVQQQVQVTHLFLTWSRKDLITNSNPQGPLTSPDPHIQQSMAQSTAAGTLHPLTETSTQVHLGRAGQPSQVSQSFTIRDSQLQKMGLGALQGQGTDCGS